MRLCLRSCRALFAGAALMASLIAPRAHAEDGTSHLERAQEALASLEYEAALHSLEKALLTGKNGPEELKEVHRLLGEVHGSLGHSAEAEQQFRRLLALDLEAGLSDGVSPKILAPFSAAQRYMRTRGTLAARCMVDEGSASVTVHVDADPLAQVAGARAVYRTAKGDERIIDARGHAPLSLEIPAVGRVELTCAVLDEHGNRLIEIGSWEEPMILTAVAAGPDVMARGKAPRRAGPRPLYARWYLWGTASVLMGGAGVYFAMEAHSDQKELDELQRTSMENRYSDVEKVERRGKRNALLANIGLGAAGAFALAAAITWGLQPESASGGTVTAVAPVPMRDGAGVSVKLSF